MRTNSARISDRIGLHEAADARIVDAGSVGVEAGFAGEAHVSSTERVLICGPLDLGSIDIDNDTLTICRIAEGEIEAAVSRSGFQGDVEFEIVQLAVRGLLDLNVPPGASPPVQLTRPPDLRSLLTRPDSSAAADYLLSRIRDQSLETRDFLHAYLLLTGAERAELRRGARSIKPDADGVRVVFPPLDVLPAFERLCQFLNTENGLSPLALALIAEFQTTRIHAFPDGNGRLGRALCIALACRSESRLRPHCIPLAPVFYANAAKIVAEKRALDQGGNIGPYLRFGVQLVKRAVIVRASLPM